MKGKFIKNIWKTIFHGIPHYLADVRMYKTATWHHNYVKNWRRNISPKPIDQQKGERPRSNSKYTTGSSIGPHSCHGGLMNLVTKDWSLAWRLCSSV